jgi:hypothetical protein
MAAWAWIRVRGGGPPHVLDPRRVDLGEGIRVVRAVALHRRAEDRAGNPVGQLRVDGGVEVGQHEGLLEREEAGRHLAPRLVDQKPKCVAAAWAYTQARASSLVTTDSGIRAAKSWRVMVSRTMPHSSVASNMAARSAIVAPT